MQGYKLSGTELESLQEYQEFDNESIGYERNIAKAAQSKLIKWLKKPCPEHPWQTKSRVQKADTLYYDHRYLCPRCMEELE